MVAITQYSVSDVLLKVTNYFLDYQEISEGPDIRQKLVTNFLIMGQPPQSLSKYPLRMRSLVEENNKPCPAVHFRYLKTLIAASRFFPLVHA